MLTVDLLTDLGFKPARLKSANKSPKYRYHLGDLLLTAEPLNGPYFWPEYRFSGTFLPEREACIREFFLPEWVESYEHGVAAIVANLEPLFVRGDFPTWFENGASWVDQLPSGFPFWIDAQRHECFVQTEWFRVAARKLKEAGRLAGDDDLIVVNVASGVLQIKLPSEMLIMPARADAWPKLCICGAAPLRELPAKYSSEEVCLSHWGNRLHIGDLRLEVLDVSYSPLTKLPANDACDLGADFQVQGSTLFKS